MTFEATRRVFLLGAPLVGGVVAQAATLPFPRWGDQGDGMFVNLIMSAGYSDVDAIK